MRGILLLNGEPYTGEIDCGGALVYCCDGAYGWAKGRVRIDKNVGDFDSLGYVPDPPPEEIYPSEKDFTDGEIALRKLIDAGCGEIDIFGGGGGREDHFLGNLHLLHFAERRKVKCVMHNDRSLIFAAEGKIPLGAYKMKTVSVFPFGGILHIMDFKGLKYGYPASIGYGECRGVSNIVLSPEAYIDVRGVALIIVNKGEV